MTSTPNKRKNISLEEKYEIIKDKQKGMSVKDLAEKYNYGASTICTITKAENAKKVLDALQSGEIASAKKRMRKLEYPDIDEAMDKWYDKTINTTNTIVDGPSMKRQAEKFATMLGHTDFKASDGWLSKFKHRHNIGFKTVVGEAGFVSEIIVQDWNRRLIGIIDGFSIDDIYNADESGLLYKAQATKTMQYKNMPANSVKKNKERLSILFASNWSGTHKLKPVVIGKFENPRCFKNVNKANLGVYYRANKKAWMDEKIFREWLYKFDAQMRAENRKILLFLDNFSGHSTNKVISFFIYLLLLLYYA